MSPTDWPAYLDRFHTKLPGIAARVLEHVRAAGGDPYDWIERAVPAGAMVLDLACGDAPLWTRLPGRLYLGADINSTRAGRRPPTRRNAPGSSQRNHAADARPQRGRGRLLDGAADRHPTAGRAHRGLLVFNADTWRSLAGHLAYGLVLGAVFHLVRPTTQPRHASTGRAAGLRAGRPHHA